MPRHRPLDLLVPGTPEEVAARLRTRTRWRPLVYQSSILGQGGLGGRVGPTRFKVSDDTRQWLRRALPVARATLESEGGSTRVRGTIGLPGWVTWLLRLSFVLTIGILGVAVAGAFTEGLGPAVAALATLGTVLGIVVASIGWQVNLADEGVEALAAKLQEALRSDASAPLAEQETRRCGVARQRE